MGLDRFIKRLAVFGAWLLLGSIFALVVVSQVQHAVEHPRLVTMRPRLDRLAELGSPKMVVVGGSNLSYGLNSSLLEEAFGMPVTNMGVQASLTIEFLLESIRPQLESGDVVVVVYELEMYLLRAWSSPTLIQLVGTDPSMIRYMTWRQIVAMPRYMFEALLVQVKQLKNGLSRRRHGMPDFADGLLENGDYVGHRGKPSKFVSRSGSFGLDWVTTVPYDRQQFLADFAAFCRRRGVTLYFGFPAKAAGQVDVRTQQAVASYLRNNFTVIGDVEDYYYPDSFFYDTEYHLLFEMRDVRTRQLIRDLDPHLRGMPHGTDP